MSDEHLTLIGTLTQSTGNGITSEQGVAVFSDISIISSTYETERQD